jgi:hypothetical protein
VSRYRRRSLRLLPILVCLTALAQTTIPAAEVQNRAPSPGSEAEVRAFMPERQKASINGDVEAIAKSMTDDYVQTDIYDYRQDKTTWLKEYFEPLAGLIKAGKFRWVEYEHKDQNGKWMLAALHNQIPLPPAIAIK